MLSTAAELKTMMRGVRYVLLDCDGVLWAGDKLLPGVRETLEALRSRPDIELRFITNNASISREAMVQGKFKRLGLDHVSVGEVLSSAFAARVALRSLSSRRNELFDGGNVLVLGNVGLHEELRPALAPGRFTYGLELHQQSQHLDPSSYDMNRIARCWSEPILPAPLGASNRESGISLAQLQIAAVVIGLDFHFSPTTLAIASMALQAHDRVRGAPRAHFIATNRDPQINVGPWLLPGAGSFVQALECASGRRPDIVCGKPATDLFTIFQRAEMASGKNTVRPDECLMVGDRLSTDIAFGNAVGAKTLFLLCGCETLADIPTNEQLAADPSLRALQPHFVAPSLAAAMQPLLSTPPAPHL